MAGSWAETTAQEHMSQMRVVLIDDVRHGRGVQETGLPEGESD